MANQISAITRRDVFDAFRLMRVRWYGDLNDVEFLRRVFDDLNQLPSDDVRYTTMQQDIYKHRIDNDDWDVDWVYSDRRLNLIHGPDDVFLRFVCEVLHPLVQSDDELVHGLREAINPLLRRDGYELAERVRVGNRPVYIARHLRRIHDEHLGRIRAKPGLGDVDYVARQITRMETSIDTDPALAVGTAKELVETVCKTILEERGITVDKNWDIGQLTKHTVKELQLTPDDISDAAKAAETIKRLLSNLANVTQGIGELRNAYGTGHGKKASERGLQPRHAKLAVGAASTLAVFLFETHLTRRVP